MYLREVFYIPMIGIIWSLYFPVLRESTLGSTTEAEKKAGNYRQSSGWRQFPALPLAPAVEPRVQINDQHTKN
jgi:hypothetical protein